MYTRQFDSDTHEPYFNSPPGNSGRITFPVRKTFGSMSQIFSRTKLRHRCQMQRNAFNKVFPYLDISAITDFGDDGIEYSLTETPVSDC